MFVRCPVCFFCFVLFFFFASFKQAEVSVSAMDKSEVVLALSRVLKSVVQGGHVYFRTELNNTECIDQIKREISLAKVCLTCKYHVTVKQLTLHCRGV